MTTDSGQDSAIVVAMSDPDMRRERIDYLQSYVGSDRTVLGTDSGDKLATTLNSRRVGAVLLSDEPTFIDMLAAAQKEGRFQAVRFAVMATPNRWLAVEALGTTALSPPEDHTMAQMLEALGLRKPK